MFTMHKLSQNLIFHRLRNCTNGLTKYKYDNLDVSKIINMKYKKRLFCIHDKEYPWTLEIEYDEIDLDSSFFLHMCDFTKIIKKRYATENEVIDEIETINQKIGVLKYHVHVQSIVSQNKE